MRWVMSVAMGAGLLLVAPSVWAADGDAAATVGLTDASREQILQTIEATKQTDPALSAELERQLKLMESGQGDLTADLGQGLATGVPSGGLGDLPVGATPGTLPGDLPGGLEGFGIGGRPGDGVVGPPGMIGPPDMIGPPGEGNAKFEEAQADPRMQEVRTQFESGQISETDARDRVVDILRDHGIEPAGGREWEHEAGETEGYRGGGEVRDGVGLGLEHGREGVGSSEGSERAWETMSPEGREQLERLFGGYEGEREAGEQREQGRGMPEHAIGDWERGGDSEARSSSTGHEYEAPTREAPVIERSYEAPTREASETERTYEAPTREAPVIERSYEAPEAPTREATTMEHSYEAPTYESQYQH